MKTLIALLVLLACASPAFATDWYIRDGASGTGTTWANACDDFSGSCAISALGRGDTIYMAGGTYAGNRNFNKTTSGSTVITIKAATIADHGTSTGWLDSYSVENGQAHIAASGNINWQFTTSYWVVDGMIGDRSSDSSDYGFIVDGPATCSADHVLFRYGASGTPALTDLTFRHIAFESNCPEVKTVVGIKGHSQVNDMDNLSCWYCFFDRVTGGLESNNNGGTGNDGWSIRYSYFKALSDTAGLHYEWINANGADFTDLEVAFNIFARTQRGTGGIVANNSEIDGCSIYSNLFLNYTANSNGMIGAGTSHWFEDCTIVNNTFANMTSGPTIKMCVTFCANATGNVVENNLFFNVTHPTVISCGTGCTKDYNAFFQVTFPPSETNGQLGGSADPFVDSAGGDYQLSFNTDAGTTLSSPYTTDIDGIAFGIGGINWSRGAYQFVSGPLPGNSGIITISALTSTTLTLTWTAATGTPTLTYYGCRSSSAITSVSGCVSATQLFDYTAAKTTHDVTGLTPLATVYFNVIVKDGDTVTALYAGVSQVLPCGATKVVFTSQPVSAILGGTLGTVRVAVQNASNTICTDSSASVVLSKNAGATWGTLTSGSSLTKSAVAGEATWTDLSVTTTIGSGSIDAASSGLTGATSSSITISPVTTGIGPGRLIFR